MYHIISKTELCHHGILGMKWGKKNGPPYPLGASDHSASEKKAGWKKSLGGGRNEDLYDRKTVTQKAFEKKIAKLERKASSAKNERAQKNAEERLKRKIDEYKVYEKQLNKKQNKHLKDSNGEYKKSFIEGRRNYLMKRAKNDELRKELENATDEQIIADYERKEKIKKAIIIGGTVVGTAAAGYLMYRLAQHRAMEAAIEAKLRMPKNPMSTDELMKRGLSLETANGIKQVVRKNTGSTLISRSDAKFIKQLIDEHDFVLEGGTVAKRVDFHKDFDLSKIGDNPLYMAIAEHDNKKYQQVLPNRTGSSFSGWNVEIKGTKDIRMPSKKNTERLLRELAQSDKEFVDEAMLGFIKMVRNNGVKAPESMLVDAWEQMVKAQGPLVYNVVLAAGNNSFNKKVRDKFASEGYNAMWDFHDILDKVSDLPVINLDNSNLVEAGKEIIDRTAFKL